MNETLKFACEPIKEIVYSENDEGEMVPEFRSAVETMSLAGGELALLRIERLGEQSRIVVFGWKVRQESLSSGYLKTYVRTLDESVRDSYRDMLEFTFGCPVFAW
jgi:hypothetical protein